MTAATKPYNGNITVDMKLIMLQLEKNGGFDGDEKAWEAYDRLVDLMVPKTEMFDYATDE